MNVKNDKESISKKNNLHYNLNFLSPKIRQTILDQEKSYSKTPQSSNDFNFYSSRKGVVTLKWRGKNLHSSIDPLQEASRRMEGILSHKYSTWVFLGADLLYSLDTLDNLNPRSILVLVFLDWNFFFEVFKSRRILSLGKFSQVKVITLEQKENILQVIKKFISPATRILVNEVLYQKADDLKRLKSVIEEHSRMLMSSFFTRYYFDRRWMKNLIHNWGIADQAGFFSSLQRSFRKERAILIGSGVSLAEHIYHLKELSRKGYYLVAVDTALPTLLRNRLSPHIIVALDGGYDNAGDFYLMPDPNTLLITYPHLYPTVIRNFPGPIVFFHFQSDENEGICDSLISTWSKKCGEKSEVIRTSNVSAVAIQILNCLGFQEVILSGIDFSFPFFQAHPPDGMHHCHYLKHQDRFHNLETYEFEEIHSRMTMEDKFRFQSNDQSREKVTTLLMEHSYREFREKIKQLNSVHWKCLPSTFSRIGSDIPQLKISDIAERESIETTVEKIDSNLIKPIMDRCELQNFLEDFHKTILTAEGYIKNFSLSELSALELLEKKLDELGWNLGVIFRHISFIHNISDGMGDQIEKVIGEVEKVLRIIKVGVANHLRHLTQNDK